MEWPVVAVFLVFIGGLVVVTMVAVKHAGKTLHNKAIKPTRWSRAACGCRWAVIPDGPSLC